MMVALCRQMLSTDTDDLAPDNRKAKEDSTAMSQPPPADSSKWLLSMRVHSRAALSLLGQRTLSSVHHVHYVAAFDPTLSVQVNVAMATNWELRPAS